ncbi:branched-chain amino acid transport system ATP-binding protein [Chitinivorax tropicus]|uniref:Branched-chain amino acid transport system ATP-binding protein n=1 Tax=Chitinivorax tropicus TaxID=714531 RepID=A0A840MSV2_9PROT|nr:ABC transporter ATP-binding protein [Chitinivorax tropicus]MBB5019852.1 branched-chain amino acid transport system ATP-binding protein [Chitinivorax tropicus]
MSLLEVNNLSVAYGGIQAVRNINLNIEEGELVSLIGANGAGKTTTLKTLSGMLQPAGGKVVYRGLDINTVSNHTLVSRGLALVPEGRGIFGRLTVTENLQMGAYYRNDNADIATDMEKMFTIFPRLKERHKQLAGTLSGGEQQMVAIARALMGRPKLLLLDEPSMGLAPIIVQKIFEVIKQVSKQGVTILLVEQNAKLALQISDRGYVMESGRITLTDNAQSLLNNDKVRQAYLGE